MNTESYKKSRRVRELTVTLVFGDTTSAEAFKLPKGARLVNIVPKVKTAFATGTTELDIGTLTLGSYFVDGADLSAAGLAALGTALQPAACDWEATEITPIYMNVGAGCDAGEVQVTVMFSQVVDRRF